MEDKRADNPTVVKNILTFEVEDRFHEDSPYFEIEDRKSRIIPILIHLLDLLDDQKARATFFVLGWVAKKFPEVVALLDARGHEVASHGFSHGDIRKMTPEKFQNDLERSRVIIEDILKKPVAGFKASSEYFGSDNLALFGELADAGYKYDCSFFTDSLSGKTEAFTLVKTKNGKTIIALPQTAIRRFGITLRVGERLRLYPLWLTKWSIDYLNRRRIPAMLNLKLWELDHHQKRASNSDYLQYERYGNLNLVEAKLTRLLDIFEFTTCAEILQIPEAHNTDIEMAD